MTDLETLAAPDPLATTPAPGSTNWVPVWNLNGGMDIRYNGDWAAGSYTDGDIVMYNGVAYLCVRPTTAAPTPWSPGLGTTSPSVRVYRSTNQSIPNAGGGANVSFDSVRYDRGPSAHWIAGSPTRLTCQVAGTYQISAFMRFQNNATGIRQVNIGLNGVANVARATIPATSGFQTDVPPVTSLIYLNVGDYVEVALYQTSGVALNVEVDSQDSIEFAMALVSGMPGPPGPATPVSYGTQLPSNPVDGQEAILVDSTTNPTYQWRFRYNAQSTSAYKWEFVGGPPGFAQDATDASINVAVLGTWYYPTTPVAFTMPRAGEYLVSGSCRIFNGTGTGGATPYIGFANVYGGNHYTTLVAGGAAYCYEEIFTTQPANTQTQFMLSSANGTGSYSVCDKMLKVTPKRVS